MNEIQAWVVVISLVVGSVGIVGIFVMVWRLVDALYDVRTVLTMIDTGLGQIRDEGENLTSEIERLANGFENWNEEIDNDLT